MGKIFETKEVILDKLKNGRKTLAELSEELGLAKATVSQHLAELERMGAVHSYGDEHFRRWKYFEAVRGFDVGRVKMGVFNRFGSAIAMLVVIGLVIGAIYYSSLRAPSPTGGGNPYKTGAGNTTTATNSNSTSTIGGGGTPGILAALFFNSGCTTAQNGYCYLPSNQTRVPSAPASFKLGVWENSQAWAMPIANVTVTITSNGMQLYKHVFPLVSSGSGWTASSNVVTLPATTAPLNWSIYVNYANGGNPIGNVPISVIAESNPSCRGCQ